MEPIDPSLTIAAGDIKFGESVTIAISTNATFSGNVLVQIDGRNYTVDVVNGTASLIIPDLSCGQYAVKAIFDANGVFKASEATATFTVNKLPTAIISSKVSVTYGSSKYLIVTLKDRNGNVLANKIVTVKINNVLYSKKTNSKGQIAVAVPKTLAAKSYIASITFAGDKNYAKATGTQKVVVSKATPKIIASAKLFKVRTKIKLYAVTLRTNLNKVMKNTIVTLKVNGKTYVAKTNSIGKATFKITKLTKKTKYIAVIRYNGNSNFKAVTKKVLIIVR